MKHTLPKFLNKFQFDAILHAIGLESKSNISHTSIEYNQRRFFTFFVSISLYQFRKRIIKKWLIMWGELSINLIIRSAYRKIVAHLILHPLLNDHIVVKPTKSDVCNDDRFRVL